MKEKSRSLLEKPFFRSRVKSANVKIPELLIGYFIGPFGALLSGGIFTSQLQIYFTDVLKISASYLMWLQLFSTLLVVAGNLIMGQLIERTKTMQGKARPWILLSALTLSVASVLMFIMPFQNYTAKVIWTAIAYNLFYSVAYPIYNTANSTLIPVSTRNGKQRGLLASVTNVAGLGVMGAGSMVFPILVSFALKENQWLWFVAMLAIAIFCLLACLLQYLFTRERVTEESLSSVKTKDVKSASVKQQLKAVASDKMWWLIIIFYLIFQWSGAMKNGSMAYFCKWFLDNSFWSGSAGDTWGASQALLGVLGAIPMAIAVVFVWPLSNKIGKKNLTVIGMFTGVAGGIIAIVGGTNIVPVAIGVALKCLGSAPACYMILAMIADVLDHIEAKNGFRCDGFTMSIYSSIMVAATPICNAVFSGLLALGGYDNSLEVGAGLQSEAARTLIQVSYVWIETVAYAVCGILLLFFVVEKGLKAEQKQIRERQKAETLARGEEWIEPEERMRLEQEEQDRISEEARKTELRAYCEKKGLSYEAEEAKYQEKLAAKRAAAEAKAAAKQAKADAKAAAKRTDTETNFAESEASETRSPDEDGNSDNNKGE